MLVSQHGNMLLARCQQPAEMFYFSSPTDKNPSEPKKRIHALKSTFFRRTVGEFPSAYLLFHRNFVRVYKRIYTRLKKIKRYIDLITNYPFFRTFRVLPMHVLITNSY
jgi:hypothetical protein